MDIDNKLLEGLADALIKMQKKEFNSELNKANVEYYREGIVVSVNTDIEPNTATVQFAFDTIKDIPNLSGSVIKDKQKVKVFYNNKNMVGCYIGTAF